MIKRLINATLSRDGDTKFNAYFALSTLLTYIPSLKTSIKVSALWQFILVQTNIKKNCGGKPSEIQAYAIGKILIIKALYALFVDNTGIIGHLVDLFTQFVELEEQIIEVVSQLVKNKKTQMLLTKLNPNSKSGFVLLAIIRNKLKVEKTELNINAVEDVITELMAEYPKRSICLGYLGPQMRANLKETKEYLQEQLVGSL